MNVPGLSGTLRDAIQAIRELAVGASNATGSGALTAGATTTTVADQNAAPGCTVLLTSTSAGARAARMWVSAKARGSFAITHDAAAAGSTFDYLILH